MPTTNDKQKQNSKAAQAYFKGLGTTQGTTIAGYMETLSHAIADNNLELYAANAPLLEETFKNLTEAEQKAYMVWGVANLKPVKD